MIDVWLFIGLFVASVAVLALALLCLWRGNEADSTATAEARPSLLPRPENPLKILGIVLFVAATVLFAASLAALIL